MKKTLLKRIAGIAVSALTAGCLALLLTGCSNLLDDKPADFGTVRVSLTQGPARTAMPKVPTNPIYTYTFTKDGVRGESQTSTTGEFALAVGTYTLDVKAYVGTVADNTFFAEGDATFSLSAQAATAKPKTVPVTLIPIVNEGTGTLTYSLTFNDATVTSLTLTRFPADTAVPVAVASGVVVTTFEIFGGPNEVFGGPNGVFKGKSAVFLPMNKGMFYPLKQ